MKVLIAILALGLTACSSEVEGWRVRNADRVCADRGGVDHLNTFWIPNVVCGNGEVFSIPRGGDKL